MKNKKILSVLTALCLTMGLCAFDAAASETSAPASEAVESSTLSEENAQNEENEEAAERTVTVTDMSGDEVTFTGEVNEIVNLWPAGTSSFFVMGAGDLLSGLSVNNPGTMNEWTQFFYPDCVNIPALGGTTPSIEELMNLQPDMVVIHPTSAADGFAQQIRDVGIPAININFSDYETMTQAYTILGQILGGEYEDKLNTWCEAVQTNLKANRELTSDIPDEEKPVVYYISGQSNDLLETMGASGGGSTNIMQDWVESNGGRYAAEVLGLTGNTVTAEEIFALNPDIIIVGGTSQHSLIEQLSTEDGWKDLNAVKNGRVYNNPFGCFNWDRFGLESLLQINYALLRIQPEIAAENGITEDSMLQSIIDFYKCYNGTEITEQQAGYMLSGLCPDGSEPVAASGGQGGGQGGKK